MCMKKSYNIPYTLKTQIQSWQQLLFLNMEVLIVIDY